MLRASNIGLGARLAARGARCLSARCDEEIAALGTAMGALGDARDAKEAGEAMSSVWRGIALLGAAAPPGLAQGALLEHDVATKIAPFLANVHPVDTNPTAWKHGHSMTNALRLHTLVAATQCVAVGGDLAGAILLLEGVDDMVAPNPVVAGVVACAADRDAQQPPQLVAGALLLLSHVGQSPELRPLLLGEGSAALGPLTARRRAVRAAFMDAGDDEGGGEAGAEAAAEAQLAAERNALALAFSKAAAKALKRGEAALRATDQDAALAPARVAAARAAASCIGSWAPTPPRLTDGRSCFMDADDAAPMKVPAALMRVLRSAQSVQSGGGGGGGGGAHVDGGLALGLYADAAMALGNVAAGMRGGRRAGGGAGGETEEEQLCAALHMRNTPRELLTLLRAPLTASVQGGGIAATDAAATAAAWALATLLEPSEHACRADLRDQFGEAGGMEVVGATLLLDAADDHGVHAQMLLQTHALLLLAHAATDHDANRQRAIEFGMVGTLLERLERTVAAAAASAAQVSMGGAGSGDEELSLWGDARHTAHALGEVAQALRAEDGGEREEARVRVVQAINAAVDATEGIAEAAEFGQLAMGSLAKLQVSWGGGWSKA
jgi:hypothetical protein